MVFTIPNQAGAGVPARQSQWYDADIAILVAGTAGVGVLTGCGVTAQGSPDMTLAVASGTIQPSAGATAVTVTSGNVTIGTADGTHPRIDLVTASAAGVKTVTAGTAAANPDPPALPSGHIALAMVDVPTSDTAISSGQIIDKRVTVFGTSSTPARTEATLSGDVTMTTADTFYDGPTATPAAGVYDVWARVCIQAASSANIDMIARLIANGSSTPVDETELDFLTVNSFAYNLFLSARVTANGTDPITVQATAGGNNYKIRRDQGNDTSSLHRATLLVLTKVG
jgi:hypothetical protein